MSTGPISGSDPLEQRSARSPALSATDQAGHSQSPSRRAAAVAKRTRNCKSSAKICAAHGCVGQSYRPGALHVRRAAHGDAVRRGPSTAPCRTHASSRSIRREPKSPQAFAPSTYWNECLDGAQLRDPERGSEGALPYRALHRTADRGRRCNVGPSCGSCARIDSRRIRADSSCHRARGRDEA